MMLAVSSKGSERMFARSSAAHTQRQATKAGCRAQRPAQRHGYSAPSTAAAAAPAYRLRLQRCRSSAAGEVPSTNSNSGPYFWRVVLPTALVMLVCNMDRICMSVAVLPMSKLFEWSPSVQGLVGASFLWGYMATQLVGGRLADKYGGKRVIAAAIVFFSAASILPPLLAGIVPATTILPLVLVSRFLVGVGEGVVLPSMNSLVATQVAPALKARALGSVFTGFHCGNLVGLALSPAIIAAHGWSALFLSFGFLGAPLLALWQAVAPHPTSQQKPPAADAASSSGGPRRQASVGSLLRHPAVRAITVANVVNHWGYFIYLSWIPSFFSSMYGLDLQASAFMAFVPWIAMAGGSSAAGVLADALVARWPVVKVRKTIQVAAFVGPAVALLLLTTAQVTSGMAVGLFTMALGVQSLGQAGFVANMSDVAPEDAGQLFGLCNTFGSFAGIVGVSAAGFLLEATGSFNTLFYLSAVLYAVGAVVFGVWAKGEPIHGGKAE
eukprot:jgi/Ulvmu1/4850/UM020_0136.1